MMPTKLKYTIQTNWQFTVLFVTLMFLATSLPAWLPLGLYQLGWIIELPLNIHLYPPMYVLWAILVYLSGLFALLACKFAPTVYFDEQGIQVEYAYPATNNAFIPVYEIARVYYVHHKKIDWLCIETTTQKQHVLAFIQFDADTQQKLTQCFANLFVNLNDAAPPKENLSLS